MRAFLIATNAKNGHRILAASVLTALLFTSCETTQASAANEKACRVQLSASSLDYGRETRGQLLAKNPYGHLLSLGKKAVVVTVTCPTAQYLTLLLQAAVADAEAFRFGDNGRFTVVLSHAQLDGKEVHLGRVKGNALSPDASSPTLKLHPSEGAIPLLNGHSVSGKNFTLQAVFEPYVTADASKVGDVTQWQGVGTFEIIEQAIKRRK